MGWWREFLKENEDALVTKQGEWDACNHADWKRRPYIKQMYGLIYDEMMDAGVAKMRESLAFCDTQGKIVSDFNNNRYGHKTTIEITEPAYILPANKTGWNKIQKNDGHQAGQRYVCERGTVPSQAVLSTDHCFTLLHITSASDEAVFCVVIFQTSNKNLEIEQQWISGVNYSVRPVMVENWNTAEKTDYLNQENYGLNKFFPSGLSCLYKSKIILCTTYTSESGGIEGKILVQVLTAIP